MPGKDVGPSRKYITMSLLNEHVIKLTSNIYTLPIDQGQQSFFLQRLMVHRVTHPWLKGFRQVTNERAA